MAVSVIRSFVFGLFVCSFSVAIQAQDIDLPKVRSSRQVDGLYENHPQLVAITGGKVTRFPGDDPTVETILIRNEKIEAISDGLKVPAGARVIEADGLHVYAGLIDAYQEIEIPFEAGKGTQYWNDQVRPQVRVAESFSMKDLKSEDNRKLGIATALIAPKDGVIKGNSAVLLMLEEEAHSEEAVSRNRLGSTFPLDRRSRPRRVSELSDGRRCTGTTGNVRRKMVHQKFLGNIVFR